MATYTNTGLVSYLKSKIGTPYVYGTDGQILTKARLDQLAKQYPNMFTSNYKNQCAKSIGKQTFDCSGSINSYLFDDGKNYNASKDWCSSTIKEKGKNVKTIDHYKKYPVGATVWKSGHVGTYIGNGKVIETRSAYGAGLEERKITDNNWTHILLHPGITYVEEKNTNSTAAKTSTLSTKTNVSSKPDATIKSLQAALNAAGKRDKNGKKLVENGLIGPLTISACPTLKLNSKGDIVKIAQKMLIVKGFSCKYGPDGIYGKYTKAAVKKFQKAKGLTVTGNLNNKTWKYLTGYLK